MDFDQFFQALSASSPLTCFCYDPAARHVRYVSPAYERVLGGRADQVNEELSGWWAALHPDDRPYLLQRLKPAQVGTSLSGVLLRLPQPNGHPRWLSLSAAYYCPAGTTDLLLAGTLEDVTTTQLALENAQRYQAKKDSMLEILSHDLASPLTLTEQALGYLHEKLAGQTDAELNQVLSAVRQACQEGVVLIRDFIDQEFLDSEQLVLSLERQDLVAQLGLVLDNYQQRQHAAGHEFTFEASHPCIYAQLDNNKFLQVLNNLLGNALKFTPDGGRICVRLDQQPTYIRLTVADTGIGIPATQLPHLFERFTPARRRGLRGEKSTGLGMSIIKTIVELHGGRIECQSKEGHGTTFILELPRLL